MEEFLEHLEQYFEIYLQHFIAFFRDFLYVYRITLTYLINLSKLPNHISACW